MSDLPLTTLVVFAAICVLAWIVLLTIGYRILRSEVRFLKSSLEFHLKESQNQKQDQDHNTNILPRASRISRSYMKLISTRLQEDTKN